MTTMKGHKTAKTIIAERISTASNNKTRKVARLRTMRIIMEINKSTKVVKATRIQKLIKKMDAEPNMARHTSIRES